MEKLENKPKFILKAVISRKLKYFKNHLPPLHFCGTLASALTQHNKASGSDIPLSKPAHATGVFQHNTCFHMQLYLWWQIWSTPARTNLKNTALQIILFFFYWTCWMALRWPRKQRWQDYPCHALKRLPISNCSGKNEGEYSKMQVTLAQCRVEARGGIVLESKKAPGLRFFRKKDMAHTLALKTTSWFRDCKM